VDRFASQLIIRPLACNDGFAALAIVLQGSENFPKGYNYILQTKRKSLVVEIEVEEEVMNIPLLNGEPDVLKAFLNTL
jgi:CRISPR-associated protein Cmr1